MSDGNAGDGSSLAEILSAATVVRLFGRPFAGLTLGATDGVPPIPSAAAGTAGLARIYGYSYRGGYVRLATPTVFLVYGPGAPVPAGPTPPDIGTVGVEHHNAGFAEGVLVWTAHDLDMVVRIDVTTGWLKDVLVGAEGGDMGPGDGGDPTARSVMAARSVMMSRP